MTLHEQRSGGFAAALRGFGPGGLVALCLISLVSVALPFAGALLVLLWAVLSKTPLRELGLRRPKNLAADLVFGVALGVGLKLVMKALVLPLLGAPAVNPAFHYVEADALAAATLAAYAVLSAGFGEETFVHGFLFERFGRLLGCGFLGSLATLVVVTAGFAALHFLQGVSGVENAAATGLVLGAVYLLNGRNLWPLIAAHAAFDLTSVGLIYWGLETDVARLILR